MLTKTSIVEYPAKLRKLCVEELNIRASDGSIILYVPKDRISDLATKGYVTKLQLENLVKKLSEKYSVKAEVVYTKSDSLENLRKGFEAQITSEFENIVDDVFLTFQSAKRLSIWISADSLSSENRILISKFISSILLPLEITVTEINWVDAVSELPSLMELVVATKKIQPATLDDYVLELKDKYQMLDAKWVNRHLDKLIKKKLISRDNQTKQYSLTGRGLTVIPNIKSRKNSDILRALDLGKRKW